MCRVKLCSVIPGLCKCLWNGGKWWKEFKKMAFIFPSWPVLCKWLWKKTQAEKFANCLCISKIRPNIFEKDVLEWRNVFTRTLKIERITIFNFSFCIGPVTQLNGPALGVLKHHYITKKIRELLIGNSRFLIYNLLNKLLYYMV